MGSWKYWSYVDTAKVRNTSTHIYCCNLSKMHYQESKCIPGIPSSFGQHVLADQSYCSFSYCYRNGVFLCWIYAPLVSFHFQAAFGSHCASWLWGKFAVSPDEERISSTAESLVCSTGWCVAGRWCSTSNSSAWNLSVRRFSAGVTSAAVLMWANLPAYSSWTMGGCSGGHDLCWPTDHCQHLTLPIFSWGRYCKQ